MKNAGPARNIVGRNNSIRDPAWDRRGMLVERGGAEVAGDIFRKELGEPSGQSTSVQFRAAVNGAIQRKWNPYPALPLLHAAHL